MEAPAPRQPVDVSPRSLPHSGNTRIAGGEAKRNPRSTSVLSTFSMNGQRKRIGENNALAQPRSGDID
jgi:hypothetical protein